MVLQMFTNDLPVAKNLRENVVSTRKLQTNSQGSSECGKFQPYTECADRANIRKVSVTVGVGDELECEKKCISNNATCCEFNTFKKTQQLWLVKYVRTTQ